MTKEKPDKENNENTEIMEKMNELVEQLEQTNHILTQQSKINSDIFDILCKMNHNSDTSSIIIEKLTRVAGIYAVLALIISLANVWIMILTGESVGSNAFTIGVISVILVIIGLVVSIIIIQNANNDSKKIQK